MAAFGDGDGKAHLDDTDLVRLNHHLPKLSGDQDVTLLWDCRNKQRRKGKCKEEDGPMMEITSFKSAFRLTDQQVSVRVIKAPGARKEFWNKV